MSITLDGKVLGNTIPIFMLLRDSPEVRIDVNANYIRLRSLAESKNVFVDMLLPLLSDFDVLGPFESNVRIDPTRINDLFKIHKFSSVKLTLPFERSDSKLVIYSSGLTINAGAKIGTKMDNFTPDFSSTHLANTTFSNIYLENGFALANMIGENIMVSVNVEKSEVVFSDWDGRTDDSFRYTVRDCEIEAQNTDLAEFYFPISPAKGIIERIPSDQLLTLTIMEDYLEIHTVYPKQSGKLTMVIPKILPSKS